MATPYWALKFLLHVIIFGIYAFTLTYDTYYLAVHPGRNSYGGRFKFLTFWNEVRNFNIFLIFKTNLAAEIGVELRFW